MRGEAMVTPVSSTPGFRLLIVAFALLALDIVADHVSPSKSGHFVGGRM
jgi:hypothetical protein